MQSAVGGGRGRTCSFWRRYCPGAPLVGILFLQVASLVPGGPVGAQEPQGFGNWAWGTPWSGNPIRTLPGCGGQGEVVTDVEGLIARVAQPECVGYRFAEGLRVNLILLYPEIKWQRVRYTMKNRKMSKGLV